jgi:glycosyltransferase involved in cell wall biosynthesis
MRAAACLFARDEERDIAEWIAHHFAVGFDAVVIYDNGSRDRTPEIALAFREKHDVTLTGWPRTDRDAQSAAYQDCLDNFGGGFDWISFTDADELTVPRKGGIKDLLAARPDTAAVAVNWAAFGSSRHATRPPGLMSETFIRRAKSDFLPHRVVKFIARPAAVIEAVTPCMIAVDGPVRTPSGADVRWHRMHIATVTAEHSVAQISHYFTKTPPEFAKKLARGYRDRDPAKSVPFEFSKYDRNEIMDTGAQRFAPQVREIIAGVGL